MSLINSTDNSDINSTNNLVDINDKTLDDIKETPLVDGIDGVVICKQKNRENIITWCKLRKINPSKIYEPYTSFKILPGQILVVEDVKYLPRTMLDIVNLLVKLRECDNYLLVINQHLDNLSPMGLYLIYQYISIFELEDQRVNL